MPSDHRPIQTIASSLEVRYVRDLAAVLLSAQAKSILGVVSYGTQFPDDLPKDCPFARSPLRPAEGGSAFEVWTSGAPTTPFAEGPVVGARSEDLCFAAVTIDEGKHASLEGAVETAYGQLFDCLEKRGPWVPLRFWNYLSAITQDDHGLERYMRFNTGRQLAFSARLQQPVPPAASGVGGNHGASVIYCLAARKAAVPIENPRQISAYAYPRRYGPTSPSFSRASVYATEAGQVLFISGTASIVGHETRHAGDLTQQIAETLENLRAVTENADLSTPEAAGGTWAFKIYLRDATHRPEVDGAIIELFGADSQRLYLVGEICRQELLLEIEAFRHASTSLR